MSLIDLPKIPSTWYYTKFTEIGQLIRGVTYKREESSKEPREGFYPIIRANNIQDDKVNFEDFVYVPIDKIKDEKFLKVYDIIIAMSSGSKHLVGKSAQILKAFNGSFGTFCGLLRINTNLNQKFIGYYFQSPYYRDNMSKISKGVNINNLKKDHIENLLIPIPPRYVQNLIVDKIEELFSKLDFGIKILKNIKTQLEIYWQVLLKYTFEGKLTKEWREINKNKIKSAVKLLEEIKKERKIKLNETKYKTELIKFSELYQLPQEWEWTTLHIIGDLGRGRSKLRPRNDPKLYGGPYPFIQTGDVRKAKSIILQYEQTYNEEGLKQSKIWPKGTLCITIAANIADTAILGFDACFPDSIVGFNTNPNHSNINYIELFMRRAKNHLNYYAPSTTIKNINLKILNQLAIPFPPLNEQMEIAQRLLKHSSIIEYLEKSIENLLKKGSNLKSSILKRAFEGKLLGQNEPFKFQEKSESSIEDRKSKNNELKQKNLSDYV